MPRDDKRPCYCTSTCHELVSERTRRRHQQKLRKKIKENDERITQLQSELTNVRNSKLVGTSKAVIMGDSKLESDNEETATRHHHNNSMDLDESDPLFGESVQHSPPPNNPPAPPPDDEEQMESDKGGSPGDEEVPSARSLQDITNLFGTCSRQQPPKSTYNEEVSLTDINENIRKFDFRADDEESDVDDGETSPRAWIAALLEENLGDQWREELHKIELDSLDEEDIDNIRAFALRMDANLSRAAYNKMTQAFAHKMDLNSEYIMFHRIETLSGLTPEIYDCCINSCCAFLGDKYAKLDACPFCKEPRRNANGKPRARYWYLPIIPRLQALWKNKHTAKLLSEYRSKYRLAADMDEAGTISDIYDSEHYHNLCSQDVEIGGSKLGHKFFHQSTDMCLGHSMDGVALFRRRRSFCTATPIITVNYSLPPEVRNQYSNILINAIIPGPKAPKDVNSFMVPMIRESHQLARGVRTYDASMSRSFDLFAYWTRLFGDLVAMMKALMLKGHNGIRPCRKCMIKAVQSPNSKHYYAPLAKPKEPGKPLEMRDPHKLHRRTHASILENVKEIKAQRTKAEANRLMTFYGVNGRSYIYDMPGMCFIASTPFDWMHLALENVVPMLQEIWSEPSFKGIAAGDDDNYVLDKKTWLAIASELVDANRTIPSAFVRTLPHLVIERSAFTAEAWSFWILYAAPILLHDRLPSPYYEHMVEFCNIMHLAMQLSITEQELKKLESMCINWVKTYEKLYYKYDSTRLPFCTSNIHNILHIPDGIRLSGPIWSYWAFVMERVCGIIMRHVNSKLHPYGTLNQRIKREAQLMTIVNRFGLAEEVSWMVNFGGSITQETETVLSRFETKVAGYDATILRAPAWSQFTPDDSLRKLVAKYFVIPFDLPSYTSILPYLPRFMPKYGKIRREGGDRIRGSVVNVSDPDKHRDNTFVRFELYVDKHANNPNVPAEFVRTVFYGQFHYVLVVDLPGFRIPASQVPGTRKRWRPPIDIPKKTHVLAFVTPYKTGGADATQELASYPDNASSAETSQFIDVQSIECAVGRIRTRGRWYIVDRSRGVARTVFVDDDDS